MRVFVVVPPDPVVTVNEVKKALKVSGTGEDTLLTGWIAAATETLDGPADGWLGRAIGVQTLEARFDIWPQCDRVVNLPYPPAIDLVSVKYLDATGTEQTADNSDCELIGNELVPAGSSFPWEGGSTRREAVRVQYRAGYETVPERIKAAIKLMVGDLYRFRETASVLQMSSVPMSTSVELLLDRLRVFS